MESVISEGVSGCKKRILQYSLRITELCNRDCKYCHYHSGINYKIDDIMKVLDLLLEHSKNDIPLFYFHGGEPTLHQNILDILKYLKDKRLDCIIEFQTNFDNPDKVLELLPFIDRLNLSFHFPDENVEMKLKYLKDIKGKLNTVDLIYIPGYDKQFKKLRILFNALNIKNEITYSFFHAENYQNNIKELGIKLTEDEIIKNKYFRGEVLVSNLLCDTSNYCIINGDGEIFKCSYALTVNKSYGNILRDKNVLINTMKKELCPFKYCGYEQAYLKDLQ